MSPSLTPDELAAVAKACDAARADPASCPAPLRALVEAWGGAVPTPRAAPAPEDEPGAAPDAPDDPEVVPPESDAPQPMGPDVPPEISEAEAEQMTELKIAAADALASGALEDAVDKFTRVIQKLPSPLVYAKRADAFVRMRKCVSAIRDCDAALRLNPDSAKALKIRGVANRYLGRWEAANADLAKGLAIDFDEDTAEIAKVVEARWHDIRTARLKREAEKRDAEKKKREDEARERAERAAAARAQAETAGGFPGGGGFPGAGGFPGGGGMPNIPPELMQKVMSDPSLMAAMQNPRVMAALQDCMQNPANFMKYQNDPEIMNLVTKLSGMVGGMGGMGGGFPGGMGGGFPGAGGPSSAGFEDVTEDAVPGAGGSASVEDVD